MLRGGGVLEGVHAELVAEVEAEVAVGGAAWFLRVRAFIQKVDRGNISPRCRHQVRTFFREIRPVSVTDSVSIHLKDLCHL